MIYKLQAKDYYKWHGEKQGGRQQADQYPAEDEQWLGEHRQFIHPKKIIFENWYQMNAD